MTRSTTLLATLLAALALAGCGGGGGSGPGGGPPLGGDPGGDPGDGGDGVVLDPDRDRDGVPNDEDRFPDDPARFTSYVPRFFEWLSGGRSAGALALNDAGQVVGFSDDINGFVKAVRWTVDGATGTPPAGGHQHGTSAPATASSLAPALLRPITGFDHSAAFGVGEDGTAVGESQKNGSSVAVVWRPGEDVARELPLGGAVGAPAAAYAARGGWIAGEATGAGKAHAVVWRGLDATPLVLPSLGGERSAAHALGAGGVVVGESEYDDERGRRGVVWVVGESEVSGPIVLPTLPGERSIALSVNANGVVVGESETATGAVRAVAWAPEGDGYGPAQDLGAGSAAAVNDRGRVAGHRGAPSAPVTWDLRFPTVADAFLGGGLFGQAYGIDAQDRIVGVAASGAFVAVPE